MIDISECHEAECWKHGVKEPCPKCDDNGLAGAIDRLRNNLAAAPHNAGMCFVSLDDHRSILAALSTDTDLLREALIEQKTWHEEREESLSKQPPGPDRDWRRMEHKEEIARIDKALERQP